jgi:hypothetical protein
MSNHTPTPWVIHPDIPAYILGDAGTEVVAAVTAGGALERPNVMQAADARHIVRCVNHHDELVKTVVTLIEGFQRTDISGGQILLASARKTLEKLEGKTE